MDAPDNHFTCRADGRQAQGYKELPTALEVLIFILCWCVVMSLFTLLGLPFVQLLLAVGSTS